jgi:para-nitrobenzyl esterase
LVEPNRSLFRFLDVPFAEPPVGKHRFKPPVPKIPWKGTLDTTNFGPCCPQKYDPVEGAPEDFGGDFYDENSLLLNIWTPGVDQKKRAVMV